MKRRVQTSITIDKDLIGWIDEQIKNKRFASRSHAVEYCIHQVMQKRKT